MRSRFLVSLCFCACAHAPVTAPAPVPGDITWEDFPREHAEQHDEGRGARIAEHADKLVGIRSLKFVSRRVPDDCTGLVRYAYSLEGLELMPIEGTHGGNGVTAIWSAAREKNALHRKAPSPGDLVFFRETYDRDRDGRRDDGLTHVGVVESVESDGTVVFVHRSGAGVTRGRVNPARPRDREVNDWLRVKSRSAPAALTGELFAGYASAEILSR